MGFIMKINEMLHEWTVITVCFRLLAAMLCGGSVGLMRSVRRRNAGFKTHALVCIGAALIMLTGEYIYKCFDPAFDVSRLAAQVVSGVGFLGVGTIIVTGKNQIQGLTTAAGLWTCAGIGIALGIGFYSGAVIATVLMLFIYMFLENMDEVAYNHSKVIYLYIVFESRRMVQPVMRTIKENHKVVKVDFGKNSKNRDSVVVATMIIETSRGKNHSETLGEIAMIDGVLDVEEL